MEERQVAIRVKDIKKVYKLYDKPSERLKEALGLYGKKKKYNSFTFVGALPDNACRNYAR